MWTIEARELMLQGIFNHIKDGAKLVFFVDNDELLTIDMPTPVAETQNGSIIFNEAENISLKTGTPTHAILSANDIDLLILPIPDILKLEPSNVIADSIVKTERFIIQ